MINLLPQLCFVLLVFSTLYMILPLGFALTFKGDRHIAVRLFLASLLGLSFQSLAGCASALMNTDSHMQGLLLLYIILCAGGWFYAFKNRKKREPLTYTDITALLLVLLLGLLVRSLHPLTEAALGQSDAYSHLQFLRDLLQTGHLRNPVYPPGYHWTLALPVYAAGLDLYTTARFVGAFYALCMMLGIYTLARRLFNPELGWVATLLAAAFPGFMLLAKTGIGAYANQLGLVFVLGLFYLYYEGSQGHLQMRGPLVLLAGAFLCSVPMMMIDALLILGFFTVIIGLHKGIDKSSPWLRYLLFLCILLTIASTALLLKLSPAHWQATATAISGFSATESAPDSRLAPLFFMIRDFLHIKHTGLSNPFMNRTGIGLALLGLSLLIGGWRKKQTSYLFLGSWLLMSTGQTLLGLFQFMAYQRAGWMLLQAACLGTALCGLAGLNILPHQLKKIRIIALTGLFATCCLSLKNPPYHIPSLSPCENALVTTCLQLKNDFQRPASSQNSWTTLGLDPQKYTTLFVRPFSQFMHHQGDVVHALLEDIPKLQILTIRPVDQLHFKPDSKIQTLVLIEHTPLENMIQTLPDGPLRSSNYASFLSELSTLYQVNQLLDTSASDYTKKHPSLCHHLNGESAIKVYGMSQTKGQITPKNKTPTP